MSVSTRERGGSAVTSVGSNQPTNFGLQSQKSAFSSESSSSFPFGNYRAPTSDNHQQSSPQPTYTNQRKSASPMQQPTYSQNQFAPLQQNNPPTTSYTSNTQSSYARSSPSGYQTQQLSAGNGPSQPNYWQARSQQTLPQFSEQPREQVQQIQQSRSVSGGYSAPVWHHARGNTTTKDVGGLSHITKIMWGCLFLLLLLVAWSSYNNHVSLKKHIELYPSHSSPPPAYGKQPTKPYNTQAYPEEQPAYQVPDQTYQNVPNTAAIESAIEDELGIVEPKKQ